MCVVFSLSVFASNEVVRIPIGLDPNTCDPTLVFGVSIKLVSDQLFLPLIRYDFNKLKIVHLVWRLPGRYRMIILSGLFILEKM
jgi:hypothetical protein